MQSIRAALPSSPVVGGVSGKAAELFTQLLLITVLPRLFGPAAYGHFAVALALVTIGTVAFSIGGPIVMARFVHAAPPADRPALARALVVLFSRRRARHLAGLALAAAALAALFPERVPPLTTAFVVVALALSAAATLVYQAGLGLGRTTLWSFRFALQNALVVAAAAGLYELWGSNGALAGIVVAAGGALAVGALALVPQLQQAERGFPVPPDAARFATLSALSGLLSHGSQRGAVVAVALLVGSTEAGFAALAVGAAVAVSGAVGQAFMVQLPSLAERWAEHAPEVEEAARRMTWQALALITPLALAGALTVDPLVHWLWGPDFSSAGPAFGPALALMPIAPVIALTTQAAALRLRPEIRLVASGVGAVVFLATALVAVPAWGAAGGTAALLAGAVAGMLVCAPAFPALLTPALVGASFAAGALVLAVRLAG